MKKRIFITGGTGRIGQCIAEALHADGGYEVLIGTRGESDGGEIVHVDYSSLDSVVEATRGVHTIIHMGFFMRSSDFVEQHICGNTVCAYNIYEAARINGIKRVIFGSSNHVFGYYKKGEHITSDSLYRPDSNYAVAKVFTETIGRYYSDRFGVSCFNIRIGNFPNSTPHDDRATHVWLSNRDCQQLFLKLIEYDPECMYLQMFGMSGNDDCFYDTSDNARVGYLPQDNGADYRGKTEGYVGRRYMNMSSDDLTRHDYVGGYNNVMDQNGEFDLEYLARINAEAEERKKKQAE